MHARPAHGLFVTGTDTEVGKTYVATLIVRCLRAANRRVGVYKPVASGCSDGHGDEQTDDAWRLWEAAGRPLRLDQVCPQRFAAPLAPHLAAREEGKQVDTRLLRGGIDCWRAHCDIVVVEGAGGLFSPVTDEDYNATLAAEFGYPLIIVTSNQLGAINQTLQAVWAASAFGEGLKAAGVILNQLHPDADSSAGTNRQELAARCPVPVLAEVSYRADRFDTDVDWFAVAAGR